MKTKINELCRAANVTTAYQLQKLCNLSPSQAARIFNDKVEAISLSVLETLCNSLKCSPNDIFGFDVAPESVKASNGALVVSDNVASDNEIIGSVETASILGINQSLVTRYAKEGRLKGQQGRKGTKRNQWTFRRSDVLEFMPT